MTPRAALFLVVSAGGVARAQPDTAAPVAPAPKADATAPDAIHIDRLVAALSGDESFKVRLQAAVLLGRSGDERAIQPLIDAMGDVHYTVRAAAAMALSNLKEARAISHIIKRVAVDPEYFVREEASRALAKYDRETALPYVVATCGSPDPRVRKQALAYLVALPTPMAEPVLMRALGDTPEIFDMAKDAVAKLAPADQLRFLDGALEHREPSVRRGALEVLQALQTPEATQRVLRVYERDIEEDEVRNAARTALRGLRSHLPIAQIVKDATTSPEKYARGRALRLLGVLGGDEAKQVLLNALSENDDYVRGNAVMAMAELGDPSVVPSLEKLVDDPANHRIIHLVRHTLKQLRTKKAN